MQVLVVIAHVKVTTFYVILWVLLAVFFFLKSIIFVEIMIVWYHTAHRSVFLFWIIDSSLGLILRHIFFLDVWDVLCAMYDFTCASLRPLIIKNIIFSLLSGSNPIASNYSIDNATRTRTVIILNIDISSNVLISIDINVNARMFTLSVCLR